MPDFNKDVKSKQTEAPYLYLHERLRDVQSIPKELQADVKAYCKVIFPMQGNGKNQKHFPKLKEFAEIHPQLVDYLAEVCQSLEYPLFESGEVIFYTLATLALSNREKAIAYLNFLIDLCIAEKHSILVMLCAITFILFPNNEHGFSSKIESYYDGLNKESEFFPFTEMVGLDISACISGKAPSYSFVLSTIEHIRYKFQVKPNQEKDFYTLDIRVYLPHGTKQCFSINLTAPNDTVVLEQWYKEAPMSNRTYLFIYNYRTKVKTIIENGCSLLHLKETIQKIEDLLGITFHRTFVDSSYSRGVKNRKALQEWMLK